MAELGAPPPPQWHNGHVYKLPGWIEPVLVVSALFGGCFLVRRRNYSIWSGAKPDHGGYFYERMAGASTVGSTGSSPRSVSPMPRSPWSSTPAAEPATYRDDPRLGRHLLSPDGGGANDPSSSSAPTAALLYPPKRRRLFGTWTVRTPNSSRFARHWHSRVMNKFPFLMEMFYWVVAFLFYTMTSVVSMRYFGGITALWDVAQVNAVRVLEAEAWIFGGGRSGSARWLEWRLQRWVLAGASVGDWRGVWLTMLNRSYALIHIPGSAAFIAWYYWEAPTFARFSTFRRTISLVNSYAFVVFTFYPCAPPRFLPKEYGFVDTVSLEDAESVLMGGQYANRLAAMPSMHFAWSLLIGSVCVLESGILDGLRRRLKGWRKAASNTLKRRLSSPPPPPPPSDEDEDGYDADSDPLIPDPTYGYVASVTTPTGKPHTGGQLRYRRAAWARIVLFCLGVFYPTWILLAIMITGNHYLLDAVVGGLMLVIAWATNRVLLNLLPIEDWLLWVLRLEKPEPLTGWARQGRGKKISCN